MKKADDKQERPEEMIFALAITEHRRWGILVMPYIITPEPQGRFFTILESILSPDINSIPIPLSGEAETIIKLTESYSEKNLFRLFSKEGSLKDFTESLTEDKLAGLIRPYIETKIARILAIVKDGNTPLFRQKIKSANLHHDEMLTIHSDNIDTLFHFTRTGEGTLYSLSLTHEGQRIDLTGSDVEIIVNSPTAIRVGRDLYTIAELDSGKVKPFMSKNQIFVGRSTEKRYYKKFIAGIINNFDVKTEGFSIVRREPEKSAILTVEKGIKGIPSLLLQYSYQGNTIFPDDKRSSFVHLEEDYNFIKYHRDYNWEEECRAILGDYGLYSENTIHFMLYSQSGETGSEEALHNLIELLAEKYDELTGAGFVIKSGSLDRSYNLRPLSIESSQKMENDWFDIRAEVIIGDQRIPFIALRNNILNRNRLFELKDGSYIVLPERWFHLYHELFSLGEGNESGLKVHKQHFTIVNQAFLTRREREQVKLEALAVPGRLPDADPPDGLNATLKPYQKEGFRWLLFLRTNKLGGCLADDMGLGKTIQALALLQHIKENSRATDMRSESGLQGEGMQLQLGLYDQPSGPTSLVIAPASLIHNWENEIKRYTPGIIVSTYRGVDRRKDTSCFTGYDIILSSYHTVRQDIDIISSFNFHYIILDESQVIKNPSSALYKAISRLQSDHKVVLTGTPVENSLTDLWTQLNFVNPGILGSLLYFRKEFSRPVEEKNDHEREKRLKSIIKPFILRRTKQMVASELPGISEQTVWCDMTDDQYQFYDRQKSAIRNAILKSSAAESGETAMVVLRGLMELRQIANHPALVDPADTIGSGKFDIVVSDIKSLIADNHKILIFSSFVKHLNLYAGLMKQEQIRYSMLTGSTLNRKAVVEEFNNDISKKVFLISIKAGGVGLNLTAADYVFILDPWWNPAVEMQALNRAHRIGQTRRVFVIRYISAGTIEEKIVSLQERKSRLADTFINSNNPLKDMDVNEILKIID